MDTLIKKINDILAKENYTFKQLADHLNLTEQDLESGLMNKTLEIRHLEDISKTLRVPLYSIFREANAKVNYTEKPYFINKLWNDNKESTPQKLMEEIEILKKVLTNKENELNNMLK